MTDWQGGSYEPRPDSPVEQLLHRAGQKSAAPPGRGRVVTEIPPPPGPLATSSPTQHSAWAPEVDNPPREAAHRSEPPHRQGSIPEPPPATTPAPVVDNPPSLAGATMGAGGALASEGWRATVNRLTFGALQLGPGPAESARLADERDAGVQLSRPVTVMVANTKGSAGKTPTTAMLAALLGRHRGGGVVAWDNNENQGTLGLRTEEGRFPTTAVDLLANLEQFENGQGRLGDLGQFVRHQQSGPFDVLASAEDSRKTQVIGEVEFARIHKVLTTFYQVIVVDTGNALLAPNWRAAADAADVLVIPLRWSYDHVRSAERMIDQLRATGEGELVSKAITVISHAQDASVDKKNAPIWREWFEKTTAQVLEVPYDPHIAAGTTLDFNRLLPATQAAYLRLGAAVSRTLSSLDIPYSSHS